MKFKDAISDFLHDKDYYISLYEDKLHVFRYVELKKLEKEQIIISFVLFDLIIKGNDLTIIGMNKDELLIQGKVISVIKNER